MALPFLWPIVPATHLAKINTYQKLGKIADMIALA